ncbi:hypothetical protein JRQ81_000617, partial [Phrynocephalus forsythii]
MLCLQEQYFGHCVLIGLINSKPSSQHKVKICKSKTGFRNSGVNQMREAIMLPFYLNASSPISHFRYVFLYFVKRHSNDQCNSHLISVTVISKVVFTLYLSQAYNWNLFHLLAYYVQPKLFQFLHLICPPLFRSKTMLYGMQFACSRVLGSGEQLKIN